MAHYAFLTDENIVVDVITGKDETELIDGITPEEWYENFRGQKCVRTSYNASIRYNFAAKGYSYDPIDDAFIPPMPNCNHQELTLNELKRWECSNAEHEITKDTE
ncbi:MAG: hypothetical protein ACR2IJ_11090 [Fluviibacter sp.]